MMVGKIFLILFCLINNKGVESLNPLGYRSTSSLRSLELGTAVVINNLRKDVDHGKYNEFVKNNYRLIQPENEFKPRQLWNGENKYNWNETDWLLGSTINSTGWAQLNKMDVRGHTLVWAHDDKTPDWLLKQESSITSDKAKVLLHDYIKTVVQRYKGKIKSWDVINEAIDDSSQNSTRPYNLRDSFWFRKLGKDFLKYSFIYAHQADPNAELYYNDYNIEFVNSKSNRLFDMVKWLKSEGIPIHGVGMQWHVSHSININPNDQYYKNAQRFIDNGFYLMVTELDISIPTNRTIPLDPNDLEKQALLYRNIFKYYLHFHPKCRAFQTWGFTDRYSWLPYFTNHTKGNALITDFNYQPKSAFWQIQEEINRVIPNGLYRLSPFLHQNKYLTNFNNKTNTLVHLSNNTNHIWNITWNQQGTYRLSPDNDRNVALKAFYLTEKIGQIQTLTWKDEDNQEWIFSPRGKNIYRISPRNAWWRVLTVDGTSNVVILDAVTHSNQEWIIIKV